MDSKFIFFSVGIFVLHCFVPGVVRGTGLVTINGVLVHVIDNCDVHNMTSCPGDHCCTKKTLTYPVNYVGDKPAYQLECKPLRKPGEFCYFDTPENFCPCTGKCHTNGFYGHCI